VHHTCVAASGLAVPHRYEQEHDNCVAGIYPELVMATLFLWARFTAAMNPSKTTLEKFF